MADLRLPDGSLLLHIGPHKTGTTTIQAALGSNRERMREQGVVYPGSADHSLSASMAAAVGKVDPGKRLEPYLERWHGHLRQIRESGARLGVLSSEFYSDAPPERIRWVLDRLGPTTHVVVTLRPVARILTSQWQQYVQNQLTLDLEEWLEAMLSSPEPGGAVTPTFWRRHRHDLLIESWKEVVGPDRITAVVLDERDKSFLPHSFEDLLGLERGTLTVPDLQRNRSLTYEEAQLLRAFNRAWAADRGHEGDYTRFVRFGAARELVERPPAPGLHSIKLPPWAAERISEIGAGVAERIAGSGIRVVGSLDHLSTPPVPPETGENPRVETLPAEVAASLVAGLVTHLGRVQGRVKDVYEPGPVQDALARRHRAANVLALTEWPDSLRSEIRRLDAQIAAEQVADEAGRRAVVRELWRRARARLRR